MSIIKQDYGQICDTATQSMIAPIQVTLTADRAYAVDDRFILNGQLYKVTSAISSGGTITIGTNAELSDTVSSQIKTVDGKVGVLSSLATTVKTNLVAAINEVKGLIPTVNNATLTIQKNGTNVATFTANASSNV